MKTNLHTAHHVVFSNDTPTEQLIRLLSNNQQVLTQKFKKELVGIINDAQDDDRAYKNGVYTKK